MTKKKEIGMNDLVRMMALQDNEMKKMNLRIIRLEKFVGVAG